MAASGRGNKVQPHVFTVQDKRDLAEDVSYLDNTFPIIEEVPLFLSCRLGVLLVSTLGLICAFCMNTCMSVALVCMTNNSTQTSDNQNMSSSLGNTSHTYTPSTNSVAEFDWSRDAQGWVLSSYYIGMVSCRVPAGFLARKIGPRKVIGVGITSMTILTLLTPVTARTHIALLMVVQMLKGLSGGVFVPSFFQLIGQWAPPKERGLLVSIFFIGSPVGSMLGSIVAGLLCNASFAGGWPGIFYTFGMVSAAWCVAWFIMGYSSPAEHPWISTREMKYIQASLSVIPAVPSTKKPPVPLRQMFTTPAVYAVFAATISYSWCWYVALTCLPQYLRDVLKLDITENGFYNSLPYIANALISTPASILVGAIVSKKLLSLTNGRKFAESISCLPTAAIAVGIGFLREDQRTLAIVLLTLWVGLLAFSYSGSFCILVDMAPKFAGIIKGVDATLNTLPGVLAPIIISAMTPNRSASEWRVVFFVCAAVGVCGWLIFTIFSSAEEQSWANPEEEQPNSEFDNKGLDESVENGIESGENGIALSMKEKTHVVQNVMTLRTISTTSRATF